MLLSLERFVSIYLPITSRTWTTRRKVIVILLAVAALLCGVNLHHLWTYDLRQRWVMVGWGSCVGSISTTCGHTTSDRGEWWLGETPVCGQSPPPVGVPPRTEVSDGLGESPVWCQSTPPVGIRPQTEVSDGWVRALHSINLHHLWMYNLRQRWVMVGWASCVASISTTCGCTTSDRGDWQVGLDGINLHHMWT